MVASHHHLSVEHQVEAEQKRPDARIHDRQDLATKIPVLMMMIMVFYIGGLRPSSATWHSKDEETLGEARMWRGNAFQSLGTMTEKAPSPMREERESGVEPSKESWLL